MRELISYQNKILAQITDNWYRSLFAELDWEQRLLGIKGLRGVGKTTMMLQYLKYHYNNPEQALYVTADNPWFYEHSLFELIEEWDKNGGKLLLLDEIHKYPGWARELKVGYDGHPEMQFIFSASSAFDIFKAEGDLSRRAVVIPLPGLSLREYLHFTSGISIPPVTLEEILHRGEEISREITGKIKPIPLFKKYIRVGYFPFGVDDEESLSQQKFSAIINAVLENDLAYVQDYSPANVQKIKKLLGIVAGSAPFSPNISKIAGKLKVGRNTIYNYLKHLDDAHILNLVHKSGRGISVLQKPDKIYFENTSLALALNSDANAGTLRETFFLNQLKNSGHTVHLAKKGDFLADEQFVFEVGGKNKRSDQIRDMDNAWLALDDIEYAFRRSVPLWLFGFLY